MTDGSTTDRRHTAQGNERKQQLLDAARTLIGEHGFANTRIADICSAAGVAKGLFYWYFPTKESLFAELVRTMRQQLRRAQATAMDPTADPVTRLRQGTEATLRFMVEHSSYFAVLDAERTDQASADIFREGSDIYTRDVVKVIEEAQAMGLIPPGNPRLYAIGTMGVVSSFSHALRSSRFALDADEVVAFACEWSVQALSASSAATSGSRSATTASSAVTALGSN